MNKLRTLLTWGLLTAVTHVMGYTITVNPIQIKAGQSTDLIINLNNTETNLTAYQMKLYLPEGVTVQKKANGKYDYTANADRQDPDLFSTTVMDAADGSILIACYSAYLDVLTGTSGELIRLPIEVASTVTTSLQGSIRNIGFTDVSGQIFDLPDVNFTMTLDGGSTPVTGITLSQTSLSLSPGSSQTLTVTIQPTNATNKSVTWSSSNTSIATVDQNGKVTAKASGSCTITCAAQDGSGVKATCAVTVVQPVTDDVTVGVPDITITAGGSSNLIINMQTELTNLTAYQMSLYLPQGVTVKKKSNGKYDYTVNADRQDPDLFTTTVKDAADGSILIAVFSADKDVLAGTSGELIRLPIEVASTVTTSLQGSIKDIEFTDVNAQAHKISDVNFTMTLGAGKDAQTLSLTSLPAMTYGDAAYTLPATTAENLTLTWTSSNAAVATVSGNVLTIKGAGTATVTASQAGNDQYLPFSKQYTLNVAKAALTITADDKSKQQGEANPELTVSYSGFQYSDDASVLTTPPTVTTTATTDSPAGTYPITVSGASAANYSITYVSGTLTVTKVATIEVTDISQLDNVIYIEPFEAHVGDDVQIKICLKNAEAITGYIFSLVLPEGITIAADDEGDFKGAVTLSSRSGGATIAAQKISDNTYSIGVISVSSLTGNDGLMLTIKAHVQDDMADGIYPILITNSQFIISSFTKLSVPDTQTSVTVANYRLGDVNGDGEPDLLDAVLVLYHSVGKPVPVFIEQAADVNGDGEPDLLDAVLILYYSVGKIQSFEGFRQGSRSLDPQ